jgi:predicted transcriptional regulator
VEAVLLWAVGLLWHRPAAREGGDGIGLERNCSAISPRMLQARWRPAMKAIINTDSWDSLQARALAVARQVDAGETPAEVDYHLSFADAAQLFSVLTPSRLALLERLKGLGATSLEALAEQLQRDPEAVRADLAPLLDWALIEEDGTGRLCVPWDAIELHVTLCDAQSA